MPGYVRQKFSNRYKWEADAKVTKLQKALILILMLTIQPEQRNRWNTRNRRNRGDNKNMHGTTEQAEHTEQAEQGG